MGHLTSRRFPFFLLGKNILMDFLNFVDVAAAIFCSHAGNYFFMSYYKQFLLQKKIKSLCGIVNFLEIKLLNILLRFTQMKVDLYFTSFSFTDNHCVNDCFTFNSMQGDVTVIVNTVSVKSEDNAFCRFV